MRGRGERGSSLIELIAVMAVIGISVGAAVVYLQPAAAPVETGAVLVKSFFGLARARATATTSAYRLTASSSTAIAAEYAGDCADTTWTDDPELTLDLPSGVWFVETDWSICFTGRGASDTNVTVTLTDPHSGQQQVEVLLGGSARIVE
jgi:prepilin-type N-terminal cleavage/methylation domain-containing protein